MEIYIGLFLLGALSAIEGAVNSVNPDKQATMPMVAFMCNKPAMHLTENGWQRDETTDCLHEPIEILNYCRSVYPDKDITNVVDYSEKVTIPKWCRAGKKRCRKHSVHTVTPYRCLEGAFQSDALLVPEHCVFDHVHESKACRTVVQWNTTSTSECSKKSMAQQSFAMLLPCGIDMFSGVEFVCCPNAQPETPTMEINTQSTTTTSYVGALGDIEIISDDDEDDAYEDYDDDYDILDNEAQDIDDENDEDDYDYDELDENSIVKPTTIPQPAEVKNPYDAYLREPSTAYNEHQAFQRAKSELQKHHHEKVTKMMKEWATAREHVQEMRSTDPKAADKLNREITARFQKTYEALEQEGVAERGQLSGLHQQRVQSQLNEKKRFAMEHYMTALQDPAPQSSQILKALKHYIKTEQKDRMHAINHYEHIRDTAPEQSARVRQQTVDHLAIIDQRIEQAIQMLNRVPDYSKKIQLQIEDFMKSFHEIDVSIANLMSQPVDLPAEDSLPSRIYDDSEEYEDTIDEQAEVVENFENEHQQDMDEVAEASDIEVESDGVVELPTESQDEDSAADSLPRVPLMEDDIMNPDGGDEMMMNPTRYDDEVFENEHSFVEINQPHIAHQQSSNFAADSNYVSRQKITLATSTTTNTLGIAIGCIVVFVVIVVGAVVVRRRSQNNAGPGAGFVEVDQASISPEERHVANMQMNGYENPTYKFFEMNAGANGNNANGGSNA